MGYLTVFEGDVKLSKLHHVRTLKKFVDNDGVYHEIEVEENNLYVRINTHIKNSDEDMQKLAYFIALIDRNAIGEIECTGEDTGDLWRIRIKNGRSWIENGRVVYDESEDYYENKKTLRKAYEYTGDGNLSKKVILSSL